MAKRSPPLKVPAIRLDRSCGIPLHRQLYLGLRKWILAGDVREGERLPSSRALARMLGISRNTVVNAYEKLADRHYLITRIGAGTRVCDISAVGTAASHFSVTNGRLRLTTILERSCYPLRRAPFQDQDGNVLYFYDSRQTL
jgi:DNA-binding transcriptional MocR family regulator